MYALTLWSRQIIACWWEMHKWDLSVSMVSWRLQHVFFKHKGQFVRHIYLLCLFCRNHWKCEVHNGRIPPNMNQMSVGFLDNLPVHCSGLRIGLSTSKTSSLSIANDNPNKRKIPESNLDRKSADPTVSADHCAEGSYIIQVLSITARNSSIASLTFQWISVNQGKQEMTDHVTICF